MASETVNIPPTGVTAELYRAAIGPRAQDYYLRQFAKFDANGKTSATWHWPAYWSTLNWLIYRRMWGWALAYMAALLGLALLIFGVGKLIFSYSDTTGWLLFMMFLTGAFVVPGLYANAWFYTYCNEKISTVLRSTSEIKDACETLSGQASNSKRWFTLASVNVAMMALLAGVMTFVLNPAQEGQQLAQAPEVKAVTGPLTVPTQPVVAPASALRPEPQSPALTMNAPVAATPATGLASGPAAQPAAPAKTEEVAARAVENQPAKLSSAAESVRPELSKPVQVAASTDKPAAAAAPAVQVAQAEAAPAVAARPVPVPAVRVRYVWVVQVGAYAQESNAQKTRARVEELGLETGAEPVTTAAGQLIRVRVGPFTRRDEAEKAALRIKSLDLPALVLRQRP
jgi:cell division protein FtsN